MGRLWRSGVPALGLLAATLLTPAASASCAGPPIGQTPAPPSGPLFTGRMLGSAGQGTVGTRFRFDVESVERGAVSNPAIVDIDVIQYVRDKQGRVVTVGSSPGSIEAPRAGATYRVEAYIGRPGGVPRLFITECGGKLALVEPPSRGVPLRPVISVGATALLSALVAMRMKRVAVSTNA